MKKTEMHKEKSGAPKEVIALEQHQIFHKTIHFKTKFLIPALEQAYATAFGRVLS